LGFFRREQYIDPRYKKQIEDWDKKQRVEKGKRIAGAITAVEKGHLVKGLAQSLSIGHEIREEIKEGDTSSFPYLLGLAILVDIVDFIPVIGTIVHVVAWPILFYGTFLRGRMKYKAGIRMTFFILNLFEIIPGISWLPLETLSIILLWRSITRTRREKENEELDNEQEVKFLSRKINEVSLQEQKI